MSGCHGYLSVPCTAEGPSSRWWGGHQNPGMALVGVGRGPRASGEFNPLAEPCLSLRNHPNAFQGYFFLCPDHSGGGTMSALLMADSTGLGNP